MSVLSMGLQAHTIRHTAFGPYDTYCMFLRAVLGQQVRRARACRSPGCGVLIRGRQDYCEVHCWFASHDYAIGSFSWYCKSLGLKEWAIRRKIQDEAARSRGRRRVARLLKEIGKVRA